MYHNRSHAESHPQQQHTPGESQAYFVTHDFEGAAELSTTLAHAISDVSGVDVTDAGFTLADHADPEALDRLFEPREDGTPRMNGHLTFTVWRFQVTVYSDGQIAIVPPRQPPQPYQA
jgi:hypothetical protein